MKYLKSKTILVLIFSLSLLANDLNVISQNKITLIKELFIVKHAEQISHNVTKDMLDSQIKLNNLGVQEQKALYKFYNKYMSYKHIEQKMIELYANAYSEQDIKNMTEFYKTSTGQKTIFNDAKIAIEMSNYSVNRGRFYQKELEEMIKDEYNKKHKQLKGIVLNGTTYFNVNRVSNNEEPLEKSSFEYELGIYHTKTNDKNIVLRKYINIKKNTTEPDEIIKVMEKDLSFSHDINAQIIKSKDGRINYPKIYNNEYIIVKVISSPNKKLQQKKLTLIKENHAEVFKNNIKYIMDSYIVLMENPYYITIERKDNAPIVYKEAIDISSEYIKSRGCTSSLKLLPKLDKVNLDRTKWMIGVSC